MNITQMRCGERATVLSVECDRELKERLSSLNIRPNATVRLVKISFFRKTYLLRAGSSCVAIRREVAECVKLKA